MEFCNLSTLAGDSVSVYMYNLDRCGNVNTYLYYYSKYSFYILQIFRLDLVLDRP